MAEQAAVHLLAKLHFINGSAAVLRFLDDRGGA